MKILLRGGGGAKHENENEQVTHNNNSRNEKITFKQLDIEKTCYFCTKQLGMIIMMKYWK